MDILFIGLLLYFRGTFTESGHWLVHTMVTTLHSWKGTIRIWLIASLELTLHMGVFWNTVIVHVRIIVWHSMLEATVHHSVVLRSSTNPRSLSSELHLRMSVHGANRRYITRPIIKVIHRVHWHLLPLVLYLGMVFVEYSLSLTKEDAITIIICFSEPPFQRIVADHGIFLDQF